MLKFVELEKLSLVRSSIHDVPYATQRSITFKMKFFYLDLPDTLHNLDMEFSETELRLWLFFIFPGRG